MYLSDRDIRWAIRTGSLVLPKDAKVDPTSVDLHLDRVEEAKVWNLAQFITDQKRDGRDLPELRIGKFESVKFSEKYLVNPPEDPDQDVFRRGKQVVIKPGGFLLWQTKEVVGTPETNPTFICFVDGKSTRARTGILVHCTAPTIHAGWSGHIVLEIANLGPFCLVIEEGDVIAQLIVAQISSAPERSHREAGTSTQGQTDVGGKKGS